MQNRQLFTIFLILFVDVLGYGLILPLLPYYAKAYGAGEIMIGLLVASYALLQFVGAPLLGRWSDVRGRRPVLLISVAGTGIGFLLLALAEAIGFWVFGYGTPNAFKLILLLMFLSRMLDGLTGGNISVAQAYITDTTDDQNRAKGLGMIGAAFGLGFILGPALGGFLSQWGYTVPAWVAFAVSTFNLAMVYLALPESLTNEKRAMILQMPRPKMGLPIMWQTFVRPKVGPLFRLRFWTTLASGIFPAVFSLYASGQPLALSAQHAGYVLTYVGFASAVMQGGMIGYLSRRYKEPQLLLYGAVSLILGLFGWAVTTNVPFLLLVITFFAVGMGLAGTMINSLITKAVEPHEVGQVLGIGASFDSLTRILAPIIGGVLLAKLGSYGPGVFGGVVMVGVLMYMLKIRSKMAAKPLADREITL
ncbi:MAG: MFS transporter [Rhodothermia bacterium]|nr:MFS transporter [Rhodothermia bacterium]